MGNIVSDEVGQKCQGKGNTGVGNGGGNDSTNEDVGKFEHVL